MLYIGNHTSSSKGYAAMGRQIVKNGGNTFAFFTRNPRGGNAKAIDPADVAKFQESAREHEFGKIVQHALLYAKCLRGQRKSAGFFCQKYFRTI